MYLQGHPMYYRFLRAQLRHLREGRPDRKKRTELKAKPQRVHGLVQQCGMRGLGQGAQDEEQEGNYASSRAVCAELSLSKETADTEGGVKGQRLRIGAHVFREWCPGARFRLAVRGD